MQQSHAMSDGIGQNQMFDQDFEVGGRVLKLQQSAPAKRRRWE